MIHSKEDYKYYLNCDLASLANKVILNPKRYIKKNPIARYQVLFVDCIMKLNIKNKSP